MRKSNVNFAMVYCYDRFRSMLCSTDNVLDNDKLKVDFKPLYQCIHIYTSLDSLEELQRSYQADRKAQSDLILPSPLNLASLPALVQEITGFFLIEREVLRTTRNFRNERDIDELWESLIGRLTQIVGQSLDRETDPEVFLSVKECLFAFIMTLEVLDSISHLFFANLYN